MNVARYHAAATVFNGYICIAGGIIDSGGKTGSVELYDPTGVAGWRQLASMKKSRSEFSLFESNGFLCAMGISGIIEKYDNWINCWMEVIVQCTRYS